MKARILLSILVIAMVLAAISMPASALAGKPGDNYARLAVDLARFHTLGILKGDYKRGVTFNATLARKYGFSEPAIRLGEQVAAVTNDLIAGTKQAQIEGNSFQITEISVEIERYPDLRRFWLDVAKPNAHGSLDATNLFAKELEPLGLLGASHIVCGYYPNPKPSTNGPWTTHQNISDPAATLRSWGYHETWPPDYTGGGWTRPQTYQPLLCGWSTYRDHAFIAGPTTIREQNYTGSPGGEPNPEVYRSGPWPYPDWPAYVYWWHVYGPGR